MSPDNIRISLHLDYLTDNINDENEKDDTYITVKGSILRMDEYANKTKSNN